MIDDIRQLYIAIVIGFFILFAIILTYILIVHPLEINQTTADDICHNLSGDNFSIAHAENGKLICELPSYDHTTNIIIKKMGEES